MNRITIVIEVVEPVSSVADDAVGQKRVEVSQEFPPDEGAMTRDQVIAVMADALRGAGYYCPHEALIVDDTGVA